MTAMKNDLPPFLQAWDASAQRAVQPLPRAVLDAARRNWFDTAAALAAGVGENCTLAAWRSCAAQAGGTPVLATGDAALVLGTASHALDYDDVCMLATCHPSVPVVSALLALLPALQERRRGITYDQLLGAYALGTETMLRLGEWLGFRHYALGFHATGTLGTVGAAAAAAHALGLDAAQAHHALAIAASSAGGLRANFGTDTKPLHVGFAASAGVRAALLARSGARASNDVWGPAGFALAFDGGEVPAPLPWQAGMPWALESPGFEHKRFPSCYLTHRLIAGILAIRARRPHGAGEPVDMVIELARGGTAPLKHPRPATGLQGKFSGPYCAAEAWIEGRVELASFTDDAVTRAAHAAQMERVLLRERDQDGETLDTAPVNVTLRGSGWTDSIVVDWAPGSGADPMTRDELRAKWRDCAAYSGFTAGEEGVLGLLDAPGDVPAAELVGPLREAFLASIARQAQRP
jgi:2-methylcitrate dehydratase PrpD